VRGGCVRGDGGEAAMVSVQGVGYSFPDGTRALDGVDLRVAEGERVALLGPNGAGKSTLLLALAGLLRAEGKASVCGWDLARPRLDGLRREVGLVFQNPDDQLFMPSVFDEVAFAALNAGYGEAEVRERVGRALETVGMAGHDAKHPINLRGGQRKRVCIASVLVTENRLLILDEPTAGLDPGGRRSLMELLAGLESTLIIATHDLDLARRLCPRSVVLVEGRVVRDGATEGVLAEEGWLRSVGL